MTTPRAVGRAAVLVGRTTSELAGGGRTDLGEDGGGRGAAAVGVAARHSRGFMSRRVESQTFTVLSELAEARRFPSRLNATRLTTLA
jgi:hypothetical protein